ncbi:PadR family transcriptional regulator [Kiritimatiellota bacterium B12222]|nr:PadR family transcriptional regulator [Kiritimatiellota bacterium B12222]
MATRNPNQEGQRTAIISLFCLMETELSGYALKKLLKDWRIHKHLPISPATIYRSLERLEQQGLLESKEVRNGNYPPSMVYGITDAGREEYARLLEKEADFKRTEYSEHLFIGMCSYLPREERIKLAQNRKQEANRHMKKLQTKLDGYGHEYGKPYAEWLLIDHEIHMIRAQISWLDHFIEMLETKQA